ncbi:MAG: hypothetical protein QOD99_70 [Chthoniobacter sp.]|nr:hypothetical protein [Chthoniobacter sp.]
MSTVGGAALLAIGVSKRGLAGWLTAALGGALVARGLSGNCQLYQALDISTAKPAPGNSRISVPGNRGIKVEKSFFVQREPEKLFRTWRNFENLPHFMKHLESVRVLDDRRSHWVARGPGGKKIHWDAEVINEHPNEMIAWRSLDGDVNHAGTVRFLPAAGGTEVRISLEYDLPGGAIGAAVARFFHEEPSQQIEADMMRFKQMMESAG